MTRANKLQNPKQITAKKRKHYSTIANMKYATWISFDHKNNRQEYVKYTQTSKTRKQETIEQNYLFNTLKFQKLTKTYTFISKNFKYARERLNKNWFKLKRTQY